VAQGGRQLGGTYSDLRLGPTGFMCGDSLTVAYLARQVYGLSTQEKSEGRDNEQDGKRDEAVEVHIGFCFDGGNVTYRHRVYGCKVISCGS